MKWARVHWTGRLKDGRVITDSRAEPGGLPKTFTVGRKQVFECWEYAIKELHSGDKATLTCPSELAYGSAFVWPPLGGEPIPANSDVIFDFEIEDCNIEGVNYPEVQPRTTTM
jgi:FKBP-type peptidyl-prolyl cis-trans isomerase FkpA